MGNEDASKVIARCERTASFIRRHAEMAESSVYWSDCASRLDRWAVDLVLAVADGDHDNKEMCAIDLALYIAGHISDKLTQEAMITIGMNANYRASSKPQRVYAIRDANSEAIKFGVSVDPISRLQSLRTSVPGSLVLMGSIKGSMGDEKKLHKLLSAFRTAGGGSEWFHSCPEVERVAQMIVDGKRMRDILASFTTDQSPTPETR